MKFNPAIIPDAPGTATALVFLFCDGQIVLTEKGDIHCLNPQHPLLNEAVYLGTFQNMPCYTARLTSEAELPGGFSPAEIRGLHAKFSEELYSVIGYASQILTWRENHQFCSKCGARAEPSTTERAMVCSVCGYMNYPRISPSIIVAVTRGEELLMARGPHFPEGLYSVVAGFVEPGETLEQCVAREVREETGIEVKNVRYFSNQPWPFPHSLMVGFTADYDGGEIKIDAVEIEAAGWFTADNMPEIPTEATIARWLINDYLKQNG